MREPFGKRNRRTVRTPRPVGPRERRPPAASPTSAKVYLYIAGGVLFLLLAGYAFAGL
jgi:hypothetical protein